MSDEENVVQIGDNETLRSGNEELSDEGVLQFRLDEEDIDENKVRILLTFHSMTCFSVRCFQSYTGFIISQDGLLVFCKMDLCKEVIINDK